MNKQILPIPSIMIGIKVTDSLGSVLLDLRQSVPSWNSGLVVKFIVNLEYNINSINVENIGGEDLLYVNTASGILGLFHPTCSGVIDYRNIVSSDYESGSCLEEVVVAGCENNLIEIDLDSETENVFDVGSNINNVIYYLW